MNSAFDVIFVSMENWDDIWRRNQFVCAELTRRFPEMKILFVAPGRSVARALKAGNFKALVADPAWNVPGHPNITVTSPLRPGLERFHWGIKINEFVSRRHISRIARRLGIRSPLLWLNPHYAVHMVGAMGENAVIYDITDDWTSLTQTSRQIALVKYQDESLCKAADATIVCSQRLLEMKEGLAENLHLIPNGVNASHYSGVAARTTSAAPETAQWPRPVVGYTGTIHPDRVDIALITFLARAHRGSIALIGPNFLSTEQTRMLQDLGNVYLTGAVPYSKIPNYMAAFDVCITPHLMNDFTESLNPIKLWEYLAAGLPIVSTDVAGFRDYAELVYLAKTPSEFIEATRAAIAERTIQGEERILRRKAEASHHSWEKRVDQIEAVIEACLSRSVVDSNSAIGAAG